MLLVDDDETFRERLGRALRDRGFEVRTAASVDEAVSLAEDDSPEYAVVDLRMPGKGGMEMLRELKRVDAGTRSVVLTGYGSIATAVEAVRLGAVNFIPSPPTRTTSSRPSRSTSGVIRRTVRSSPRRTGRPRSLAWSGSTSSGSSPTAAATSPSPPVASGSTAARCSASSSATPHRSAAGAEKRSHQKERLGRTFPRPITAQGGELRRLLALLSWNRAPVALGGRDKVRTG